jgi:hypothetical protein
MVFPLLLKGDMMKLTTDTVLTVCLAAAAILVIPPALSVALAAGQATTTAGPSISGIGQASGGAWEFQPIGAEMSQAVRIVKTRV